MELANSIALLYLYYYLQDVIHYPKPGTGQLILVSVAVGATIIATVAIGRLSDRSAGYRRYAMLAATLLAATGFVLAVVSSWDPVIVCAFALGAGYGAYQSASSALSLTVLPDQASAARDLGIINIASSIPQVIGPSVAALVITTGPRLPRPVRLRRPARARRRRRLLPRPARDVSASRMAKPLRLAAVFATPRRRAIALADLPGGGVVAQRRVALADLRGRGGLVRHRGRAGQAGGSAAPDSAQAACRAAPSATYSAASGTATGSPKIAGAICRTAADFAAPPVSTTRDGVIPHGRRNSIASASEQSTASTAARARFSLVMLDVVSPRRTPLAAGRFGVRSPSR